MSYLYTEQVAATASVKDVDDLNIPGNATWAELQADSQDVRYTMDGVTNPTVSSGMVLLTTEDPSFFLIDDVKRIRFIRGGGSNGNLNLSYGAGRDV